MTRYLKAPAGHPEEHHSFGTYVVAPDEEMAQAMLKRRNIGELIDSRAIPLERKLPKLNSKGFPHWLTFVGYIAQQSKLYTNDIFSDTGVIHEMMHYYCLCQEDPATPPSRGRLHEWGFTEEKLEAIIADYRQLLIQIGFAAPYEEVL